MQLTLGARQVIFRSIEYSFPEFMLIVTVFSKEIGTVSGLGGVDFDLIGYPFFILYFLFSIPRIVGNRNSPVKLFAYIFFSSIASVLYLDLSPDGLAKQFIPLIIILSSTFTIVNENNLLKLFHCYTQVCFYTAVFGIVQVLLSFIDVNILIKITGKLDSIAYEPSHYAAILLPALIFSFFNMKYYKREFIVMLIALVFTFNVTGYVVFLLILAIAYINPIYFVFAIPAIYYIVFYFLPTINPYFSMRFTDTLAVLTGKKDILSSRLDVNGTTLSFFSNFEVAQFSVRNSPITGSGIGGHEEMYYRRFDNSSFSYNYHFGLNAKSGHSLSIRILSEFGLLGFIAYIFTLIKSNLFFRDMVHRSIALACLSHFLCKSLKLGAYVDYGTPFFFTILILNSKFFSDRLTQHN